MRGVVNAAHRHLSASIWITSARLLLNMHSTNRHASSVALDAPPQRFWFDPAFCTLHLQPAAPIFLFPLSCTATMHCTTFPAPALLCLFCLCCTCTLLLYFSAHCWTDMARFGARESSRSRDVRRTKSQQTLAAAAWQRTGSQTWHGGSIELNYQKSVSIRRCNNIAAHA